jgi:hypothetical protein
VATEELEGVATAPELDETMAAAWELEGVDADWELVEGVAVEAPA